MYVGDAALLFVAIFKNDWKHALLPPSGQECELELCSSLIEFTSVLAKELKKKQIIFGDGKSYLEMAMSYNTDYTEIIYLLVIMRYNEILQYIFPNVFWIIKLFCWKMWNGPLSSFWSAVVFPLELYDGCYLVGWSLLEAFEKTL